MRVARLAKQSGIAKSSYPAREPGGAKFPLAVGLVPGLCRPSDLADHPEVGRTSQNKRVWYQCGGQTDNWRLARNPSRIEFRPQFRISGSRSRSVGCRASKENEILIWIRDYKRSGTPWLVLEWLMEGDF